MRRVMQSNHKITEYEKELILNFIAEGKLTYEEIGKKFGIHLATVGYHARQAGLTSKHPKNKKFNISISKNVKLTCELLRSAMDYDPKTGVFKWKGTDIECGNISIANGYRRIRLGQRTYLAHRLAWLYQTGAWPRGTLDHINGVRNDNRIDNLRDCTQAQNNRNRAPNIKKNPNFISTGVYRVNENKFKTQISIGYKCIYLGTFPTVEEAIAARRNAEIQLFEGYTNHGRSEYSSRSIGNARRRKRAYGSLS